MYSNIIPFLPPLRKMDGVPIMIVRLRKQILMGIVIFAALASFLMAIQYNLVITTSTTMVFDPGKTVICDSKQYSVTVTVIFSVTFIKIAPTGTLVNKSLQKLNHLSNVLSAKRFSANMSNPKMPSMYSHTDAACSTLKTGTNTGNDARLIRNIANPMNFGNSSKQQQNRNATKMLPKAKFVVYHRKED